MQHIEEYFQKIQTFTTLPTGDRYHQYHFLQYSSLTNFVLGITVWFDRTLAFVGVKVLASAPADEYQQIKRDLKL